LSSPQLRYTIIEIATARQIFVNGRLDRLTRNEKKSFSVIVSLSWP
jgi:hypothetical protein